MNNKKKELGQFFTPEYISDWMVKWVIENSNELLDPAMGMGVFMTSANKINPDIDKYAFEVDSELIDFFYKQNTYLIDLHHSDYLLYNSQKKFKSIVCNPPYNKFQQIDNRKKLIELFEKKYKIRLSGYSNYCVYFLIKAINEMDNDGRCAFIMPYEFLNAGYGAVVKEYLLTNKVLKAIIKFNYDVGVFEDATTTSCIVLLEKSHNTSVDFISIDTPHDLVTEYSRQIISYQYTQLDSSEKWLKYFNQHQELKGKNSLIPFSDIAKVKRGIATGNNSYFVINKDKKEKLNLSDVACVPCISKSADIKCHIFREENYDELYRANKKVMIYDGRKAVSVHDVNYIKYGESMGVHQTYLTSHKNPWYSIEEKEAAPIWISVFSRDKLKVIRNETNVKNLTTFHSIYLNETYLNLTNILFCYLLTPVAQEILKIDKREYGYGLDKFEPNDINKAKILDLRIISPLDIAEIEKIYQSIADEKIEVLDEIFKKYLT